MWLTLMGVETMTPRVIAEAAELEADQRFCSCCERPLKARIAWLELDQRNNTYHDFGGVPADKSQGWFPFGITCARKMLARANRAILIDAIHEA